MKEYNDYVRTVKSWLKNYNQFHITIDNLRDDVASLRRLNEIDVNAPIAKYGDMPAGGMSELNTIENAAYKHSLRDRDIMEKEQSIEAIERTLRKIDRAFQGLDQTDYDLVHGYYIEGKPWDVVSDEVFISAKWAQERANKAVHQMADMIFGGRASQLRLFSFLE